MLPGAQPLHSHLCGTLLFLGDAASCLTSGRGRCRLRRRVQGVNPFKGTPFFPLSWRPLRNPGARCAVPIRPRGDAVLALSWGRGRLRRTRRNSVRGLPGNQAQVTQRSLSWGDLCITQGASAPCQSLQGAAPLHPLLGERQTPPSPAAIGEGSSAHPSPSYAKLSPGRGRFGRLRPKPVRGLPVDAQPPADALIPLSRARGHPA